MKNVCWALFGFSVLLLLIGIYSKFAGEGSFVMDFPPVAWWRASMAAVIYSIALALITPGKTAFRPRIVAATTFPMKTAFVPNSP